MSQNTDTWVMVVQEHYPKLNESELKVLTIQAANEWYLGEDTKLANLFDQYVMLKHLKGM